MRIAAIDIGTNSIHLVIVETTDLRTLEVVDREKAMIKLGAGLFATGELSERALRDGVETLGRYARLAESRGADEMLAVATSAVREARNGEALLEAVFEQTGISPRVVSGAEEGELIFRGVRHAIQLGSERALVLDMGGGSVEAVCGDAQEVLLSESMRLGVQRLRERRGAGERLGKKQRHELAGYVQGVAADVMAEARRAGFSRVIGTSGTIRALGEAAHLASGASPWMNVNAQSVALADLEKLSRELADMDAIDRAAVPGLGEQRAEAIHLGGVVLVELLRMAGADTLTLCDASLREGVVLDFMDRHGVGRARAAAVTDVRRRSVAQLARKYEQAGFRERHVTALALQLFDGTRAVHDAGERERELLEHASRLHGVGQQIAFRKHHKHGRYIIRHSRLWGFTDEEVRLIALVVRFHRGSPPRDKSKKSIRELPGGQRRRVELLAAMLRLAVALDRGHAAAVKRLDLDLEPSRVRVTARGGGDLDLEVSAARAEAEPLAAVLRRAVDIEAAPARTDAAAAAE